MQSLERGWWWRKRKCSPQQRFRGSFGHLCLRARMLLPVQFLPQNSWVHLIILGKHFVYPVFLWLAARTEQEAGPLTVCDVMFPPCLRHSWGAGQLSPSSVQLRRAETGETHWSGLRDGRRRPSVFGGCSLAGLAETKVFWMLVSLQFQMLKLRW